MHKTQSDFFGSLEALFPLNLGVFRAAQWLWTANSRQTGRFNELQTSVSVISFRSLCAHYRLLQPGE
jgi:hypothetical protein